jgi:hypothetical protein
MAMVSRPLRISKVQKNGATGDAPPTTLNPVNVWKLHLEAILGLRAVWINGVRRPMRWQFTNVDGRLDQAKL